MKMIFVQEAKYVEWQGKYYSPRINYETYWERYLSHFDSVEVLARVTKVDELPKNLHVASGNRVRFIPLPMYNGMTGLIKIYKSVHGIMKEELNGESIPVLRIPGHLGIIAYKLLKNKNIDYACELVGDPLEVSKFMPYPEIVRKSYGFYMFNKTREIVRNAKAALFVTQSVLQERYPPAKNSLSSCASNVILSDDQVVNEARGYTNEIIDRLRDKTRAPIHIGVVGMLYDIKSPMEIVHAVYKMINDGNNVKLSFAGTGPLMDDLRLLCLRLAIEDRVIFLGNLKGGNEIFDFLDQIDLFVQFSRTEGLPRSTIEAMARGCPIVASAVGGQVELLSKEYLVDNQNIEQLCTTILQLISSPGRMTKASARNILKSKSYTMSKLKKVRHIHYSKVAQLLK